MTTLPPVEVGDLVTAELLNDGFGVDAEAMSSISGTPIRPLTSSTNVDTTIATLTNFTFRLGYAYEIAYWVRLQVTAGTGPNFVAHTKVKRASSSGTVIHDPGEHPLTSTNFMSIGLHSVIVKCTAADTTQTLVLTGALGTTGTPTALDVEAASTAATRFTCIKIGLAADFPDAFEVPTA